MDLNEKIAARRRELAVEAEKVAQVEAARQREVAKVESARQKQVAIEAEKVKQAEKIAVDAEVGKRLAEFGIEKPSTSISPVKAPKDMVDAEVDKAITKAAADRMTGGENAKFTVLLLLGIGGFFIAWWVGLAFIVWAFFYLSKTTTRHKEQIIAEGKTKLASAQTEGVS